MASKQSKTLRIIPLGGLGEIGKNMTVIEYGRNLIVVDAGVMFPSNDMPGVDFILPDYQYLIERQNMIRGIVLTHGHLDHIGGLQFLMQQISAPIYGTPFTLGLVQNKFSEMGIKAPLPQFKPKQSVHLCPFTLKPLPVHPP